MLTTGVQTTLSQTAEAVANASEAEKARQIEASKQIAAVKKSGVKGVAFFTAHPNSAFVFSDGVTKRFHGTEMIVEEEEYIKQLRAVGRVGGPIWEM